ncbi:SRPBCC family protein [Nocardioides limicola]|uniref:SRPBCC family protein n=1 Tax=Nocardioides limicola TaxID=2803368 RepID=UPI00193BD5E2|nr:SRPBCC family protein [Nocardioides sp. DJM-14]
MAGHVIHIHTTIPAPPEAIWEVITDVGRHADILRSVSHSELLTEGDYRVGTTWREDRTLFGHHGSEELHVVASTPPMRTQFETRLGHDTVVTSFTLTPTPNSGASDGPETRLSMTTAVDMADRSKAAEFVWRVFGEFSYQATHRMLEHDLEDIRDEVVRRRGGVLTG